MRKPLSFVYESKKTHPCIFLQVWCQNNIVLDTCILFFQYVHKGKIPKNNKNIAIAEYYAIIFKDIHLPRFWTAASPTPITATAEYRYIS